MKHQTSSMESYRNPIAPTVHKALSPGAFQHFCNINKATFDPTGITGAHLAFSSLLIHVFLKEQELRTQGKANARELSVFRCQRQIQLPPDSLRANTQQPKLQFCCTCAALCLWLLADTLGWPGFGLGVYVWIPDLLYSASYLCLCFSLPQQNILDYSLLDSFPLS